MVTELKQRINEIAAFCERFSVQDLHLFGSGISAKSISEIGDLDFLVKFRDMPPAAYMENYFGFIENLTHIFGLRIDLVEDIAIRNPFFRKSIDSEKERLYGVS